MNFVPTEGKPEQENRQMRDLIEDVTAFHNACDVPVLHEPAVPPKDRVDLRVALIKEEARELIDAMHEGDLLETADGMADLIYVTVGAALEFGIPLDRVWAAVQTANMAKVDLSTGKVRKREDGKVLKPEDWQAPDIAAALGR